MNQKELCERLAAVCQRCGYPPPQLGERQEAALEKILSCMEDLEERAAGALVTKDDMKEQPPGEYFIPGWQQPLIFGDTEHGF